MEHLKDYVRKNLILDSGDPEAFRAQLLEYFHSTFSLFEKLFEPFKNEDVFYEQPEKLRHPHIFYLGHTATFFLNKLLLAGIIDERVHPEFESMFAIGVDEMSWDDLTPSNYDWPPVREVFEYRNNVRDVVSKVIETADVSFPIDWEDPLWIVVMGIEHERIHLETSSVLIRQTNLNLLERSAFWGFNAESGPAPENDWVAIPEAELHLGKPQNHRLYGWDNEYGERHAHVDAFKASTYLVSNGEFLQFVEAGGYQKPEYWSREGRRWLAFTEARHPHFWVETATKSDSGSTSQKRTNGTTYGYRTMLEVIDMPWDWPVDVNYLEAKAFCNWKSETVGRDLRLPTEDEWYALVAASNIPDEPEWSTPPGNINLSFGVSACPVNRHRFDSGLFDVIGNVWQWTETPISGFEGFKVHPMYDDFSTPTFDNKHNLIKGGSFISTGNETTYHARYAFRRHFFQHAGFRYVDAGPNPHAHEIETSTQSVYESDQLLAQYCEFHYGESYFDIPNFPKACAEACIEAMKGRNMGRALDLGCATGRATFELARHFDFVQGLDLTARFIRLAIALQEQGNIVFDVTTEGELTERRTVSLASLDLQDVASKCEFWQADASNLKPHFSNYDLVFAGNLIDRLYDPTAFLQSMYDRINDNGLLIICSPYTWLEEFTDKSAWLGGYEDEKGAPVKTIEGLRAALEGRFKQVGDAFSIPFVIRETARKYQHTLSECSIWEKI